MSDLKQVQAIEKLLTKLRNFDSLTATQKGAFRAQLTKLESEITEPGLSGILARIRDRVGESEKRTAEKLTADDLTSRYRKEYQGMSPKERAAFKAIVTRKLREASEAGDVDEGSKLVELKQEMSQDAIQSHLDHLDFLVDNIFGQADDDETD